MTTYSATAAPPLRSNVATALAGRVANGADSGCIACHKVAPGGDDVYSDDLENEPQRSLIGVLSRFYGRRLVRGATTAPASK